MKQFFSKVICLPTDSAVGFRYQSMTNEVEKANTVQIMKQLTVCCTLYHMRTNSDASQTRALILEHLSAVTDAAQHESE